MLNVLVSAVAFEGCENLYLNDELADVHFVFKSDDKTEEVPANKANLAVLSPVFKAMFYGSLPEQGKVPIVDADPVAFKEFLQFFYLGTVKLTMENMETVVRLADKYDILKVVNACAESFEDPLAPNNICWAYHLALILKNDKMIKTCVNKITKMPMGSIAIDIFNGCSQSTLRQFLALDFKCKEVDVFDACLAWAKHACECNGLDATKAENLRAQLGDCLKLIRYGSMKVGEFNQRYLQHKGLFTMDEFEDLMLRLTVKGYQPKIFTQNQRFGPVWDAANALLCDRNGVTHIMNNVRRYEVTSFRSNHPVLLAAFHSAATKFDASFTFDHEIHVTITEQENNTIDSTVSGTRVLYEGTSKSWVCQGRISKHSLTSQLQTLLPHPILIRPECMYVIHLDVQSIGRGLYEFDAKPMVEMTDGINIQFQRNTKLSYNNLTTGWIKYLFFHKP